jgi:hypothetical protein
MYTMLLIANSVIDINKFSNDDASDTEKNLYAKFQQKQQQVFDTISNRLTGDNPPAYKDEDSQMQEYLTYICDDLLTNTLNILKSDSIDTSDETYKAWKNDESISLKDYLNYAASQNWIDISQISTSNEYLDSEEIYQALTDYIIRLSEDRYRLFQSFCTNICFRKTPSVEKNCVLFSMNRVFFPKKTSCIRQWLSGQVLMPIPSCIARSQILRSLRPSLRWLRALLLR